MKAAKKELSSWIATSAGKAQRALLEERINAVRYSRYDLAVPREPARVTRAREIVDTYDKACVRANKAIVEAIERAVADTRRDVLFAKTPDAALAFVSRLERLADKGGWPRRNA